MSERREFAIVGEVTVSTGEEIGRKNPDKVYGRKIGGMHVRALYSAWRVDVEIRCRSPKRHHVATIYAHTHPGDADPVTRALWLAEPYGPSRGIEQAHRYGDPGDGTLTLRHRCTVDGRPKLVPIVVDLARVRALIADMWAPGRVEARTYVW